MNILNLSDTNVLLFDLGKVLIDIQDEKYWWENIFLPNFKNETITNLSHQGFFDSYECGEITTSVFVDTLKKNTLNNLSSDKIIQLWNSKILEMPEERVKLLEQLKEKHKVFLLSNTNEIHIEYINKYILQKFGFPVFEDLFDACIYSYKTGLKKPNLSIYEYAHKVIGEETPKANILFFDDLQSNIEASKNFGFQSFHVKNNILDYLK